MRPSPSSILLLASALAALAPSRVEAQEKGKGDAPVVYRREVFRYEGRGRPDPFRSLLTVEELGYRVEDLTLTGIIFSPERGRSMAILSENATRKRYRLREGQRLGGITIAAIHPRRVDVVVNEFGVIRRVSLQLKRPDPAREGTGEEEAAPPAGAAPQQPPPPQPRPGQQPPRPAAIQKGSGR